MPAQFARLITEHNRTEGEDFLADDSGDPICDPATEFEYHEGDEQ